jgi:hypothetical protein
MTKKIKSPVATLSVAQGDTVGIQEGSKIFFAKKGMEQQLSQIGTSGQMTIVKEFTRKGEKVLYKGVPYFDKAGYQNQLSYLTNVFGEKSARGILRFSAPQVQTQKLVEGQLLLDGNKATGTFKFATEKPVRVVDNILGIKTRGGKTRFDIKDVERVAGQIDDVNIGIDTSVGLTTRQAPKAVDLLGVEFKKGITSVKTIEGGAISSLPIRKDSSWTARIPRIYTAMADST